MHGYLAFVGITFLIYAFRLDDQTTAVMFAALGGALIDASFH